MKYLEAPIIEQNHVRYFVRLFLGLQLILCGMATSSEEAWFPSKYGADDTIGAANNLKPEIVASAAKLIDKGKVYSLAVETNESSPDPYGRFYQVRSYLFTPGGEIGPNRMTANESLIVTHDGLGTTLDGFGHMGIGSVYYNGVTHEELYPQDGSGVTRYGMETLPPIVSRGLLLDMEGYYKGAGKVIGAGTEFNSAQIMAAAKLQGLEIRSGDVIIFHTGWISKLWDDIPAYNSTQPGLGLDGAKYLVAQGVTLIGMDARTIEAHPADYEEFAPVHQELLTKNGVYTLEHVDTRALHADGVDEFLFVLAVPKLRGTVQEIVNPIAIK